MNCPLCSFVGPPRSLHAHLGDRHPDAVRFEEKGGRWFYGVTCPRCGDGYEQEINPRGRDPGFVEEFSAQIRLVAFDMLVNHLLGEHEEVGLPAEETAGPDPAVPTPVPVHLSETRRAKERNGP